MANFGFARLAVVAPYEPNWREAKSAVGASDLLQNAKCAERLEEQLPAARWSWHRIARASQARAASDSLPELGRAVCEEIARGGRVASSLL